MEQKLALTEGREQDATVSRIAQLVPVLCNGSVHETGKDRVELLISNNPLETGQQLQQAAFGFTSVHTGGWEIGAAKLSTYDG